MLLALAVALALALSGCGSSAHYANKPRPPAPITITAYIGQGRLAVSPAHFGAGPIVFVVTNQSSRSQRLTIQSAGGGGAAQHTGPINPGETARIQANIRRGRYLVHTADTSVRPATLLVGKQRKGAQNELLLP